MSLVKRWCRAKFVDTGMTFELAGHKYKVRYILPRSLKIMIYARDLAWNENVSICIDPESPLEVAYLNKPGGVVEWYTQLA